MLFDTDSYHVQIDHQRGVFKNNPFSILMEYNKL